MTSVLTEELEKHGHDDVTEHDCAHVHHTYGCPDERCCTYKEPEWMWLSLYSIEKAGKSTVIT